jgi:protein involved in sex pheromone biosynthesis
VKFVDKKPNKLVIDLPIDYYGQAETIGKSITSLLGFLSTNFTFPIA